MNRSILVGGVLLAGSAQAAWQGSLIGLGDLAGGSNYSEAYSVSAEGAVVVGYSLAASGGAGFRWTEAGGITSTGDLFGGTISAINRAVSGNGQVVVGGSSSTSGWQASRWKSGLLTGLGDLAGGSFRSEAWATNSDGSVVAGEGNVAGGTALFRWTTSGLVNLGDLAGGSSQATPTAMTPDGRWIAGYSTGANGIQAFRHDSTGGWEALPFPTGSQGPSFAFGITSNGGVVVGAARFSAGDLRAVRWSGGTATEFLTPDPLRTESSAQGISADGTRIVGYQKRGSGGEAIYHSPDFGTELLIDVLRSSGANVTGWNLFTTTAISADGKFVVGYGSSPQGWIQAYRGQIVDHLATGSIRLSGYLTSKPVRIRFMDPQSGLVRDTRTVTPSPSGEVRFRLMVHQSFKVLVDSAGSLVKSLGTLDAGQQTLALGSINLLGGDIDADNSVTVFDYIALSGAFDKQRGEAGFLEAADFDGDGQITIFDYNVLSENFDLTGDD